MKKIFIALSVVAVLAFSLAPVQANVPGARDIAPGSEFNTYFLVSEARVSGGSGPSTLLHMSETKGLGTGGTSWSLLHFNFYTIDSAWVYDVRIPITRWGTLLTDIGTILANSNDAARASLAVTYGGQDYYAGYIVVTELRHNADNILVDVMQLDLSTGLATLSNVLAKAYVAGIPTSQIEDVLTHTGGAQIAKNHEVFSGDAMAAATELVWGRPANDAAWFALYPKYLINDSSGKTEWIINRSSVRSTSSGALIQYITFHTWIINGAEDYRSVTIRVRELDILNADTYIPNILKVAYPYIGQVNLRIPGDLDPGTINRVPSITYLSMEMTGWDWVTANAGAGSAATNWAGMANMGADASTLPVNGYQPSH